jgi:Zn-dependent peptidase ImmA (M78 family)
VGEWIEGTRLPTVSQLEDFSRKVYIPMGFLFLDEPVEERLPIVFYRMSAGNTRDVGINIRDTLWMLQQRQSWLKEYLVLNSHDRLEHVGLFTATSGVDEIVASIRDCLDIPRDWAARLRTSDEAVTWLSERIEDAGISVVFNGVVANNTRRVIPVSECRGFVLIDDHAPFVFVNNNDAKSAQVFTLLHEVAHVWIGRSSGFDFDGSGIVDDPVERLCDNVAASFLVPRNCFDEAWRRSMDFMVLSKRFKVSPVVIGRRAMETGKITRDGFFDFYTRYTSEVGSLRKNAPGGGDFYRMTKKRLGLHFSVHVKNAVRSGQLLYRDACNLTNLKGSTFDEFFFKNKYV